MFIIQQGITSQKIWVFAFDWTWGQHHPHTATDVTTAEYLSLYLVAEWQ